MYKRYSQGWTKHLDFFVLDLFTLQLSLLFAFYLRFQSFAYFDKDFRNIAILLFLSDILILVLNNSLNDILNRGYLNELMEFSRHCVLVFAVIQLYFFSTQTGDVYSRLVIGYTFLFYFILGYFFRILWKYLLTKTKSRREHYKMLVVASTDTAESILSSLINDTHADYEIVGVVLVGESDLKSILNIPVITDLDNTAKYVAKSWVDTVYIDAPLNNDAVLDLMDSCAVMGVPTHYHVPDMTRSGVKRFSENIGGTTVLTSAINYVTPTQALIKRVFDIFAGLFGSLLALIIMAVIGPIIKIQSPGPILFKQERIGKNGKHFNIYKIRSMRMDADDLKKNLLKENRIKDDMMFKLDFDPRIIGNKILPDGTRKTGIGEFIRRTSLDEFPQFFNVLGGSMSTVGTRPPTIDEFNKYSLHHRARMAIKPGITGMWQVNGRSDITDFEEVVKLDTEYILNWSLGLDLRIIFKTIAVVFTGKGAK